MKQTLLARSMSLALGAATAGAAFASTPPMSYMTFTGSNFTMLSSGGGLVGGTNDVSGEWNGTAYTSVAQANTDGPNMKLSSPTAFFGNVWTAHNIDLFGPGTYTFTETNGATETMTIGAGQLGAHMLFDWGTTTDIGVVDVFNVNSPQTGTFWTGAATTSDSWSGVASTPWDLESTGGQAMVNGAFIGFKANFNLYTGAPYYKFRGSNFTMLSSGGGLVGGTNDVSGSWNGTAYTSIAAANNGGANMYLSSPTAFFGNVWTAHNIQVFGQGTYTFTETNGKTQTMTVGAGQVGAHMLFDWGTTTDIGVADVFNKDTPQTGTFWTGATTTSDPWSGVAGTSWSLESTGGQAMINGAFIGFKANFNLATTTTTSSGSSGGGTSTVTVPQPNTSLNNGGCAIDPNPVGAGNGGAWLIVGAFIAGLGIMKRKRGNGADPTED